MRALAVALLVAAGCAPCAAVVRSGFVVTVEDERGSALCEAVVEVRQHDRRWLLPVEECRFRWLGDGEYELTVRATGHFTERLWIDVSSGCVSDEESRRVRLQNVD
jgi:hypothetical protein